jgi:outer membrane biosynthesis protein TonB
MPPPPPQPPQKRTSVTPPKKAKPVKQPPAPMKSPMHQQHEVKTPAPLSPSVLNTLLKLQALQKQDKPPTAHYNPDAGGAPDAGGSPNSTANSGLSEADRNAIGAWVRRCWTIDAGAQNVQNYSVLLLVTTDPTGTVRMAQVSPQNNGGDMSDPEYFAFTQRAIAAVEDYQCATLPLPSNMLGQNQTFLFNFTP